MSKLSTSPDFGNLKTWEELKRFVTIWAADVTTQVSGGLEFQTNIRCKLVEVVFGVVGEDVVIQHNLGKLPTGYIVVKSNKWTRLRDSDTASTASLIYLQSSDTCTVTLLIF